MKPYHQSTGMTGRDLERQDNDFATETIAEIFPADSQGNRESLGNSSMHDLANLPPGKKRGK